MSEVDFSERVYFYALRGWGKCCRLIRRLCEHQLPSETVQRLKREFEDEKKKETRP